MHPKIEKHRLEVFLGRPIKACSLATWIEALKVAEQNDDLNAMTVLFNVVSFINRHPRIAYS